MNKQKKCCDKHAINSDEHLRVQAEMREKARADYNTSISSALRKGRAEGRAEGIEERNNELIAKWKAKGMSDEDIKSLLE